MHDDAADTTGGLSDHHHPTAIKRAGRRPEPCFCVTPRLIAEGRCQQQGLATAGAAGNARGGAGRVIGCVCRRREKLVGRSANSNGLCRPVASERAVVSQQQSSVSLREGGAAAASRWMGEAGRRWPCWPLVSNKQQQQSFVRAPSPLLLLFLLLVAQASRAPPGPPPSSSGMAGGRAGSGEPCENVPPHLLLDKD